MYNLRATTRHGHGGLVCPRRIPSRRAVVLEGGAVDVLVVFSVALQLAVRPLVQLSLRHHRVRRV